MNGCVACGDERVYGNLIWCKEHYEWYLQSFNRRTSPDNDWIPRPHDNHNVWFYPLKKTTP